METRQEISAMEFRAKYKPTGVKRSAIFGSRKALMEELYATAPIYCDQSYYAHYEVYYRVNRSGEHFSCSMYPKFEDWRDCHYNCECADADGNKVWLMSGGRYD